MQTSKNRITLVTDGACLGNPGPGGWASLLLSEKKEKMISGGEPSTTNNRMELQAVISGLSALKKKCHVTILTDSKYVMDAFEKGWIEKWEKNGWRNASKDPVKNQDLWEDLVSLVCAHDIKWKWVKGHSGHPENERVDEEARRQAQLHASSQG
jgi:ribonuclease HI